MRIIDAFWEKRNLNVNSSEIVIEASDTIDCLSALGDVEHCSQYIVVKVPTARFDINQILCQRGYSFVEGSINVVLQLKDAFLSPLQQRLNGAIGYTEMNANDVAVLYEELLGGLFGTDRILLDSHFTSDQAAVRYVNWIKDELLRNSQVYKITYKEDAIGFFTYKAIAEGVYYPFLAGMYKKYSNSGLGFATLRKPIEESIKRGGRMISTYVSSNNPAVLRAHTQQGFSINEMQYVFVKHTK